MNLLKVLGKICSATAEYWTKNVKIQFFTYISETITDTKKNSDIKKLS